MKKNFYVQIGIVCGLFFCLMYGLFYFSVYQLEKSGRDRVPLRAIFKYASEFLRYLPLSNLIIDDANLNMKIAYHIYHNPESDYGVMMKNGGASLKLYRQVDQERSNSIENLNNAKLEILNILVRIPWSSSLKVQAENYVEKLNSILLKNSLSIDDQSIAHENIAIFYARVGNMTEAYKHAEKAKLADEKQFEPEIVDAFNFLRYGRIGLGSCIQNIYLHEKWEAKISQNIEKVVTQSFLRDQYYHSWDAALVQTVLLSSKINECKKLAIKYKLLASPNS